METRSHVNITRKRYPNQGGAPLNQTLFSCLSARKCEEFLISSFQAENIHNMKEKNKIETHFSYFNFFSSLSVSSSC